MPDISSTLTAAAPPPGTSPNDGVPPLGALLFDRYRVLRELGRGGMGLVLLASDEELGHPVAVKIVPDLLVKDTEAVNDLKREVLRGMALSHPGIVRTHHFERDASGAAIVMEFVEGRNLSDIKTVQPDGCLNPAQILPWLEQLCAVLDYAHREAHLVHRDLKPRNILITDAGNRVKVADFGISALVTESLTRTAGETHSTSGTPSYMSPQQARGKKPSPLDDVYALGATLYDLLTGKPPFFRGHIITQVTDEIPPSMAERREEFCVLNRDPIPPAWEETVAACLHKDPTKRPQSAGEVLLRLQRAGLDPAPAPIASSAASTPVDVMEKTFAVPSSPEEEAPTARIGGDAQLAIAAPRSLVPNAPAPRLPEYQTFQFTPVESAPRRSNVGAWLGPLVIIAVCGSIFWGLQNEREHRAAEAAEARAKEIAAATPVAHAPVPAAPARPVAPQAATPVQVQVYVPIQVVPQPQQPDAQGQPQPGQPYWAPYPPAGQQPQPGAQGAPGQPPAGFYGGPPPPPPPPPPRWQQGQGQGQGQIPNGPPPPPPPRRGPGQPQPR